MERLRSMSTLMNGKKEQKRHNKKKTAGDGVEKTTTDEN
jgi:hypothetical protein